MSCDVDADAEVIAKYEFLVSIELRYISGNFIARFEAERNASMGQYFARLRSEGVPEDVLRVFEGRGSLVLLESEDLGARGEVKWSMGDMYCRPAVGSCAGAELEAGRPLVFQVVLEVLDVSEHVGSDGRFR